MIWQILGRAHEPANGSPQVADRSIALQILEAPGQGGRSFLYNLSLDGQPLVTNVTLSLSQVADLHDIRETYDSLFPRTGSAQFAQAQMEAIGVGLFKLWLEPHWNDLTQKLRGNDRRILWIRSDQADVLNLPWELLRVSDRDIGTDSLWGVRRLPWMKREPDSASDLRPGPLRILFVACSPRDFAELDYEREEELLSRAIGGKAVFETSDLGTYKELTRRIDAFEPHIVHLSGHGRLSADGSSFCFETEEGNSDLRSAKDLGRLFADGQVQCAFISGCEAGKAPPRDVLGGVCQAIVAGGTPLAIGWGASIVDDVATKIAEVFYQTVVGGRSVDFALARARMEAQSATGDPSWSLPVLYATTEECRLFDGKLPNDSRPQPFKDHTMLPGMGRGYSPQFVGRRRELQKILVRLRLHDEDLQGVILTGIGGAGKSSLATRLARKLQADGNTHEPIAISCEPHMPLKPKDLLAACGDAFLLAGQSDDHRNTINDQLSIETRLRLLVAGLNRGLFVLVIDGFESSLNAGANSIIDPEIAKFYVYLLNNLTGTSRIIFTSRFLPADVDPLPITIAQIALGDLSEAAYLKFLFRDPVVRRKYQINPSQPELLVLLYRLYGGTPGFVAKMRSVLKKVESEQLLLEIKEKSRTLVATSGNELRALEEVHEDYCKQLSIDGVYGRLSADSQRMLSRAAAYVGPVTLEALAALPQSAPEGMQSELDTWIRSALTYSTDDPPETRWSVYGALRAWLLMSERLSIAERRHAHCAAGDYLVRVTAQSRQHKPSLTALAGLSEARAHFLAAAETAKAREVGDQINDMLLLEGNFALIERLSAELLEYETHPNPVLWIARSYLERPSFDEARQWYEEALKGCDDRYPAEKAQALHGLATINIRLGCYSVAREELQQALAIRQSTDNRFDQGITWHQLATIDMEEKKYEEARAGFETALSLFDGQEAQPEIQAAWHQLGSLDLRQERFSEARRALQRALDLAEMANDSRAEAAAIQQLGRVDLAEGKLAEAQKQLQQALEIRQSIGDRRGEAMSYRRLSELAARRKRPEVALVLSIGCYIVNKVIALPAADDDLLDVQKQASALGYKPDGLNALLQETEQRYLLDRGRSLHKILSQLTRDDARAPAQQINST